MKTVTVGAIAVLVLLVGFGHAGAEQNNLVTNLAGQFTNLSIRINYEEEQVPYSSSYTEGQIVVLATSSIGQYTPPSEQGILGTHMYNPILYLWVDGQGNLSQINITWLNPNDSPPPSITYLERIWTVSCAGGNQRAPIVSKGLGGVTEIEDGTIANKPPTYSTAITKPTTRIDQVQGVLACYICPDGFEYTPPVYNTEPTPSIPPTLNNTTCNGGESYTSGYLTFQGTFYHSFVVPGVPDAITSASISGTLAGGSFNYLGEAWAAKPCNTYGGSFLCKANFAATFTATLAPCTESGNEFCWNGL